MEEFVLDCSVAMAWCFSDEANEKTQALLDSLAHESCGYVPSIWLLEVSNVLLIGERKKRISQEDATRFFTLLWSLPINIDTAITQASIHRILEIGRNHQMSAYDASYLELALRRAAPIATLDRKMRSVAKKLRISCNL